MGRVVGLRVEKMVSTRTYFVAFHSVHPYTDVLRLTMGTHSEKCVVRRFSRVNVYFR
jgi:hypothetical protein